MKTSYIPIYDIDKTYDENLQQGPNKKYKATLAAVNLNSEYSLLGIKVNSPFGTSACPTGCDSNFIKATLDAGFDIVTTKTRRSVHYEPNPMQNIVYIVPGRLMKNQTFEAIAPRSITNEHKYETLTLANSFGNNSIDPSYWVPDQKRAHSFISEGKLLITSIVGTIQPNFTTEQYYDDFVKTALLAKNSGSQAIEINFSCPNVADEGVLCYDKAAVLTICTMVKRAIGMTPLIAKLGFFPPLAQPLLESIASAIDPFVEAIAAINTFAAPIYDKNGNQALPGRGRLKAGLSGHAVKDIGLDMIRRLHEYKVSANLHFEIIGIGGVLTPEDFNDYRQAGADAVLSASGAMWNPNLALQIKASLR